MRNLLYIIFILSYFATKAQTGKEAWHWYFGGGGIINFNSGVALSAFSQTSPLVSSEGCASLSNPTTGQLIMYTNGVFVCDSNHHTMFNGINLFGNQYSSQSSIIVPKPGSSNLFYIISVDAKDNVPTKGVHYSIADITFNNGQGKIIVKNKVLTPPPTTEKVTAVKHCNGTDYWIITHPYLSDAFNAYLVTATGIDSVPLVSHVGTFIQDTIEYQWDCGYLKASPNGKKLALAEGDTLAYLELFDFDNSTGIVSNAIKFNNTKGGMYGVSFSPDNSKLYAASYNLGNIYQYDLSSNVASTIIASQYIIIDSLTHESIGYETTGEIGAIQMAPDGKIYIARNNVDTLAVINNPNSLGAACNFNLSGFPLVSGTTSYYGLPNFIDANYVGGINLNLPNVQPCDSFSIDTLNAGVGFTSYQWSTGATTNSIVVNSSGKYWVTVINQQGCMAYDTLIVQPATSTFTFIMPNIVTPNEDNINDEIDFSKYQFSSLQLEIYNRWGLKVFESNDPNCIWKPSTNDNDGTYFANLQYKTDCGTSTQNKNISKFITLVR